MSEAQDKAYDETTEAMQQLEIELKILHLLSIYPVISPTMLQGGLGPYTKAALWRPVLAKLVAQGKVIETQENLQTPSDRYNTYTKLSLATVDE